MDKAAAPETANKQKPGGDWISENLEAVIVAIIMALVIRQFCIEAFKIPTSSMEPTLIGRETGGDRILVNKFAYKVKAPRRWDVVVFKYPLNRKKNFIKRLVGLPGEEIMLRAGDLYVRGPGGAFEIQRKPREVQDILWQEVYPVEDAEWSNGIGKPAQGEWRPVEESELKNGSPGTEGASMTLMPSRGGKAWMYYNGFIYAHAENVEIGDLIVSFNAVPLDGMEALKAAIAFGPESFEFKLPASGKGQAEILRNRKPAASADVSLPAAGPFEAAFYHADAVAGIRINGKDVLSFEYEPDFSAEFTSLSPVVKIGTEGGGIELRNLKIHRDLYYFTEAGGTFNDHGRLRIPPDNYVVLGDNSSSSKDSRLWMKVAFETLDGSVVEGDADMITTPNDKEKYFRDEVTGDVQITDVNGRRVHLKRNQVKDFYPKREFAPFVPAENLIGQAFMVFWPVKRLKLIR